MTASPIKASATDDTNHDESRFAHIGVPDGSWATLCGYVPVRQGTREEGMKAGYCLVCLDLYEANYGRPWGGRNECPDERLPLKVVYSPEALQGMLDDGFDPREHAS